MTADALAAEAVTPAAAQLALRKLASTGKVLYVAAHPDDENTRLIAWLGGALGLHVTYLSLTRGDGGQNLIGDEADELLGLLRTHELLGARQIDGGQQRFTRARDFGYSKSAEETLTKWGKQAVLADVVWAIRTVRPDVVITRFSPTPPNHGHHLASALLAADAVQAAADPAQFPEQLGVHGGKTVSVHRVARLLHNVPNWNSKPGVVDPKLADVPRVDVGSYEPLLGKSWGEVAAAARTVHKSQGFGSAPQRGPQLEHLQWLAGSQPQGLDPMQGLDFGWQRLASEGLPKAKLARVEALVAEASRQLRAHQHLDAVATLLDLHAVLADLAPQLPFAAQQQTRLAEVVVGLLGLHIDAQLPAAEVVPGAALQVTVTARLRQPFAAELHKVQLFAHEAEIAAAGPAAELPGDASVVVQLAATLPASTPYTTPWWLAEPGNGLLYTTPAQHLTGLPTLPPPLRAYVQLRVGRGAKAQRLVVMRPVQQQRVDPVDGERLRNVEVVPVLGATPADEVVVLPPGKPQTVRVAVQAGQSGARGQLRLVVPAGFAVTPASHDVAPGDAGSTQLVDFVVRAKKGQQARGLARLEVNAGNGWQPAVATLEVNHPHVPPLRWRKPAEVQLQPLDLQLRGARIGYLPGPESRTQAAMRQAGWQVTELTAAQLATADLSKLDAVVVGSRALNTQPKYAQHFARLWQWVQGGGVVLVQYQTQSRIGPLEVAVGPYPLEIGRDRVTDEAAELGWLPAAQPFLQAPNRLGPQDWQGWVQERGLYFASKWDPAWQPLLACQDSGEAPLQGGLLVAPHGKGRVIYTGLSLFRQLPAGVPGAYRLLANLLAR